MGFGKMPTIFFKKILSLTDQEPDLISHTHKNLLEI